MAAQQKPKRKEAPWYIEIPIVLVLTFAAIFLFQTFIGRAYVIPSASMEPTLHGCEGCTGDRIFVEKLTYAFSDPEPGDVVVFQATGSWNHGFTAPTPANPVVGVIQNIMGYIGLVSPEENDMVKRIIATEGQTVSCQAGDPGIMVDGAPIDSSYTLDPPQYPINRATGSPECDGPFFGPVTVPEGHIWVMGDNRTNSADSRAHIGDERQGTVPVSDIRGKVQFIFFPFSRIGGVDDPDIQA